MTALDRAETASDRGRRALLVAGAAVAAAAGLLHLGILAWIFARRVGYPFDLEWMEGGMLCHALRVLERRPIYAPPSADFISYLYTPLYPYVLAALGWIFGLGYTLGRVVSILSFALALAVAFVAVRGRSGRGLLGALFGMCAVGLAASTFPKTGAWYDLVRNDSLYLGLTTAALYIVATCRRRRWPWIAAAGVLLGFAYLTKQTASLFIVFSGLALLVLDWRRLPILVAVVAAVAGGGAFLLNLQSKGWFWKYTYEMHQGHDLYRDRLWPVTEQKLLGFFPVVGAVLGAWTVLALVLGVVRLATRPRPPAPNAGSAEAASSAGPLLFWFAAALTGVLVSAVGFATQWASENAYIPGLFFPAVFAAMAAGDLARRAAATGAGGADGAGARWLFALGALAFSTALAGQMVAQRYAPSKHLPRAGDARRGRDLVALLSGFDGPVLVPYHPFYPVLAGKHASYPQMGINDVTRAGHPFPQDLLARFTRRYYRAAVFDNPLQGRYEFVLDHYKLAQYFHGDEVPAVVEGYQVRPTFLLVPKEPEPVPSGARRVFGFEEGTYDGWIVEGTAFGRQPADGPLFDQGPIGPFEGSRLANSYGGRDLAVGRLLSPEFLVDKPVLTYLVGGGHSPADLAVRLIVDDRVVHSGTGFDTDLLQLRRVDVRPYLGSKMRLELVDRARGPWGHLLFDDLMLWDR
jgi:hypothetical protein